jgi:dCMP deaminase
MKDHNKMLLNARNIASTSFKKNTKVGVIITNTTGSISITACNGFLERVRKTPEREQPPLKFRFSEHAERKAIYTACRLGVSLDGCTMFSTHFPCCECARGIILVGINEIVIDDAILVGDFANRWREDFISSKELLMESEVKITIHRVVIT